MMDSRRTLPVAALAAAAVASLVALNLSCGGGAPTTPTTTLTPAPTPTATTPPVGNSCRFGKGVFYRYACDDHEAVSQLLPDLEGAMDRLIKEKPGIFDLSDEAGAGTRAYKVLNKEAYLDGLVANLVAAGLCAERDADDADQEIIRVKNSNEFSEDFDVLLSSGHMRRGRGAYRGTCSPPNFPANRPADVPPLGSGCYRPFPPPLYKMYCKDHLNGGDHHVLDSTPYVADPLYCAAIGFTDGRIQCAIRVEGAADREACENWRVGTAADTGRPGPTWTKLSDGGYCTGPDSGCLNSPNSQYQLWAYESTTYRVAATTGRACDVFVDR